MLAGLGKPPQSPYPPDIDDDAEPHTALGDLVDAVVRDADAANQRSPRLSALRVELRGCRLTGAELAEATLTDVTFVDCALSLVGLRHAKLRRVVFRECRMDECDFYEASLKDVRFESCDLRGATFTSARIERVEMLGCDMTGLRGTDALRTVRMTWNDVLHNVEMFVAALGVEIVEEERRGERASRR
jgi:uncharacterized protein YjbI with pentapeptide repeats